MSAPAANPSNTSLRRRENEMGGHPQVSRPEKIHMMDIAQGSQVSNGVQPPPQRFHTMSETRKAAVWLDGQIVKSGGHVTSQVVELTPALATVLLERNPENRKLRPAKVTDFAKDIMAGNWKLNGEPVIVSIDGLLNDGQHRCAAVVETKTPIMVVLVFGVERDSRDTLDQGTLRTAGDYLAMNGRENPKHLATAARALWQYRTFGFISSSHQKYAPTRTEVKRVALETPALERSLAFVTRPGARALGGTPLLAFCHYCFRQISSAEDAAYFIDALIDGTNLKRGDPILYVRNRLMTDRRALKMDERVELLFRAWNAHRKGEQRIMLRTYGGELPLLEP